MNRVILQFWEESNIKGEFLSDGCSLHLSLNERNSYIAAIYSSRGSEIPDTYDRILGDPVEVFVTDKLYELILSDKSIKIPESALHNLLKLEDIIYNKSTI